MDDLELICIEIEPPRNKPFLLLAWYRPPSDPIQTFHKLDKVFAFLDSEDKEIIFLGDTNCDLTNKPGAQTVDNNTNHLCNLYELYNFLQLIKEPTRVTLTTSSIIDHIATTRGRNIAESGVHKVSMSDHYMVFCVRKFNGALLKDRKIIKTRSMKHFNEIALLAEVSNICWERALNGTDDVNVLANTWSTAFSLAIDKHAPLKSIQVSEKYCPWINKDLRSLMKCRDKLKKAAIKGHSQLLMSSYRHVRNKVNKLNIDLKRQYFSEKITQHEGNMKESWKIINQVVNKRSKSTNINNLSAPNGVIVNKQKIADTMNEFFCSVGKDLAEKIDYVPNTLLSGDLTVNPEKKCFRFKTIEIRHIRDAIGKIKISKALGSDNISSFFLKLAMPYIENSLAYIFNTSLETSKFPDDWKTARVTPIFKDGDKSDKSNYRPISVLPVISRLFEKLVFNQLYHYLDNNDLLSTNQSGFRRLHSTVTCLLKNTDDWYTGLDSGQMLGMVFVDLKKAFDTVDHRVLCNKLELYGVQQRELS